MLFKIGKGDAQREVPVTELDDHNLNWYADECKNRAKSDAAKAERERRKNGGAPATTSAAIVPAADVQLVTGAFRDPARATDALRQASSMGHLVAPAPICGALPEGCSLALSAVQIDVTNETYEIAGKRGLSKAALDKIAGAAGISWDPHESRRLDNGSDPHYCHYRAVGRVRDFDGTVRVLTGEVEMDARDGSPLIEEITTKAERARDRNGNAAPRDPSSQILELRKFLLRHAESKAKNRAIRSLGLRTAYAAAELQKPFVVAKVQFTGESSDPETRKLFAGKLADAFLGAQGALYGAPLTSPALPEASDGTHAPPPVGSVPADDAAIPAEGTAVDKDDDVPPDARPPAAAADRQTKLTGIDPNQDRGPNPDRY